MLKSSDTAVRKRVGDALIKIGEPAVGPLIEKMRAGSDEQVRQIAEDALAKIGGPAVNPLVEAMRTGHDAEVRKRAEGVLDVMGERAVEPLIALLGDANLGGTAADALVKIGDPAVGPMVAALGKENAPAALIAGALIRMRGDDVVSVLYRAAYQNPAKAQELNGLATEISQRLESPAGSNPMGRPEVEELSKLIMAKALDVRVAARDDGPRKEKV